MKNPDGSICTTHTLSKVPFIITDKKIKLKENGTLANVAPTMKRISYRAKGSADRILKRSSHITIVLDERK